MTRHGSRKKVPADFWESRRRAGRGFLKAAQDGPAVAAPADSDAPIVSNVILAAIADALTAKRANVVNSEVQNAADASCVRY